MLYPSSKPANQTSPCAHLLPVSIGVESSRVPKLKVICVDDQVTALEIRKLLLEQLGCEVETAADPNSALSRIAEFRPDVVLLDYHLGHGIDGADVARDIRSIAPDSSIIRLTGDPAIPQSARAHVDAVVIKGTSPRELLEQIQRLVPNSSMKNPRSLLTPDNFKKTG